MVGPIDDDLEIDQPLTQTASKPPRKGQSERFGAASEGKKKLPRPELAKIALEIGNEDSPLAIYATVRRALEWTLRDVLLDVEITDKERRAEITRITQSLVANKPLERMRRIEQRLDDEDAAMARITSPGGSVSRAVEGGSVVARRGRPPKQSAR